VVLRDRKRPNDIERTRRGFRTEVERRAVPIESKLTHHMHAQRPGPARGTESGWQECAPRDERPAELRLDLEIECVPTELSQELRGVEEDRGPVRRAQCFETF